MSVGHLQIDVYNHNILTVSKQGTMADGSFIYTDSSQRQSCSGGRNNLVGRVKPQRAESLRIRQNFTDKLAWLRQNISEHINVLLFAVIVT